MFRKLASLSAVPTASVEEGKINSKFQKKKRPIDYSSLLLKDWLFSEEMDGHKLPAFGAKW